MIKIKEKSIYLKPFLKMTIRDNPPL